ncbi:MAG: Fpg/Nei family DNA glycosylase [Micrococcales bacterium]|nr:Fpg/Nei family DNA glycosylase [Micrococcales bacterium]
MPEGDTVWKAAQRQHAALAGKTLTRTDFRVPAYATVDLAGRRVDEVVARGKHLLHRIGDTTLHTHLKMEGVWRVFPDGKRWSRPAFEARVVLDVPRLQSVGFALGVVELVPRDREDDAVGHLGPDLLGPDWDAAEAERRMRAHPETPVFVALLDQRNLAGFGNVYANELCFLRGLDPHRPVGAVDDLAGAIALGRRMILANRDRAARVTTGIDAPGRRLWVYSHGGQPCRRCGTRVRSGELGATELTERFVWWCPHCQPEWTP